MQTGLRVKIPNIRDWAVTESISSWETLIFVRVFLEIPYSTGQGIILE
jgi:hypothetical protein